MTCFGVFKETTDLVTFTEEILNGKDFLFFLVSYLVKYTCLSVNLNNVEV